MRPSPITKICFGQSELCIRLVQPGCDGGQLVNYQDVRLVIAAPYHNHRLKSPQLFRGCWPGFDTPWCDDVYPHEMPALVYPAFDTNEDGDTVFRFDDKLWQLPPGRYVGTIEFNNGMRLAQLDIDLCNAPVIVDRVSVTEAACH